MQQQLAEGMHLFSHAISQIEFGHHDHSHSHDHEQTHEHKMISFFNKIFSSEETNNNHDNKIFTYTLDKHFADAYPKIDFNFTPIIKLRSKKTYQKRKGVKTTPTPPPEKIVS